MLTRAHYADTAIECEHLVNRLAANGEYIYEVVNLGHKWLILSTRRDGLETRCMGDPDQMRAELIKIRVEKPDTHGDASRPIDEELIAEKAARWDDPA